MVKYPYLLSKAPISGVKYPTDYNQILRKSQRIHIVKLSPPTTDSKSVVPAYFSNLRTAKKALKQDEKGQKRTSLRKSTLIYDFLALRNTIDVCLFDSDL